MSNDPTKLPLTEADCMVLAEVLRTPDPLDDHPKVQQRWIALMEKYPGKNALDMAADFLEHLTSAKDCCYNAHDEDCPNRIVQSQDDGVPSGVADAVKRARDFCAYLPDQKRLDWLAQYLERRPTIQASGVKECPTCHDIVAPIPFEITDEIVESAAIAQHDKDAETYGSLKWHELLECDRRKLRPGIRAALEAALDG